MPYHVTVEKRNHHVVRLYKSRRRGFTTRRTLAAKDTMSAEQFENARKFAKKKGWRIRGTKNPYPFIILDSDTKMVRAPLAKKINQMGRWHRRYIWMGEGWRTHARQQELWRQYVARGYAPPLVAYPGTSNHETGWAADISIFLHGPSQGYTNVGYVSRCRRIMRRLNLCLPVPGEKWHTQIGNNWQA